MEIVSLSLLYTLPPPMKASLIGLTRLVSSTNSFDEASDYLQRSVSEVRLKVAIARSQRLAELSYTSPESPQFSWDHNPLR